MFWGNQQRTWAENRDTVTDLAIVCCQVYCCETKPLQLGTCTPCWIYLVCEQGSPLWVQLFCIFRSLPPTRKPDGEEIYFPRGDCWFVLKNRGVQLFNPSFMAWGFSHSGRERCRRRGPSRKAGKAGLKAGQALNLEKGSTGKQQEAEVLMPFVTCSVWMS